MLMLECILIKHRFSESGDNNMYLQIDNQGVLRGTATAGLLPLITNDWPKIESSGQSLKGSKVFKLCWFY